MLGRNRYVEGRMFGFYRTRSTCSAACRTKDVSALVGVMSRGKNCAMVPRLRLPLLRRGRRRRIHLLSTPAPMHRVSLIVHRSCMHRHLVGSITSTIGTVVPRSVLSVHLGGFTVELWSGVVAVFSWEVFRKWALL